MKKVRKVYLPTLPTSKPKSFTIAFCCFPMNVGESFPGQLYEGLVRETARTYQVNISK